VREPRTTTTENRRGITKNHEREQEGERDRWQFYYNRVLIWLKAKMNLLVIRSIVFLGILLRDDLLLLGCGLGLGGGFGSSSSALGKGKEEKGRRGRGEGEEREGRGGEVGGREAR